MATSPELHLKEIESSAEAFELSSLREPTEFSAEEIELQLSQREPTESSAEEIELQLSQHEPTESSAEEIELQLSQREPTESSAEEIELQLSQREPTESSAEEIELQLSQREPTESSADTPEGKPVEDGHTPSPTSETEETKRIPTWRVVYYVLCVLTVVAVLGVALLPSVITFSVVRSPVQV